MSLTKSSSLGFAHSYTNASIMFVHSMLFGGGKFEDVFGDLGDAIDPQMLNPAEMSEEEQKAFLAKGIVSDAHMLHASC